MKGQTDNQQRKVSETDIAWLAGFWDGEGSIGMKIQNYSPHQAKKYFAPYAQVVNSHLKALERVDRILMQMQVGHHVSWQKLHQVPGGKTPITQYKPLWKVLISGLKRCKTFLIQITPYLTAKQVEAETVIDFINSREASYYKHLPYTEYELSLVNKFRIGRHKGRPTVEVFAESAQRLHAGGI